MHTLSLDLNFEGFGLCNQAQSHRGITALTKSVTLITRLTVDSKRHFICNGFLIKKICILKLRPGRRKDWCLRKGCQPSKMEATSLNFSQILFNSPLPSQMLLAYSSENQEKTPEVPTALQARHVSEHISSLSLPPGTSPVFPNQQK